MAFRIDFIRQDRTMCLSVPNVEPEDLEAEVAERLEIVRRLGATSYSVRDMSKDDELVRSVPI